MTEERTTFRFAEGQVVSTIRLAGSTKSGGFIWDLCCAGTVAARMMRADGSHYRVNVDREHWHVDAEVFAGPDGASAELNRRNNAPAP